MTLVELDPGVYADDETENRRSVIRLGSTRGTPTHRLFARCRKDANGCWIWLGHLTQGYGRMYLNGRQIGAHKAAYEMFIGPVADGLQLDHLCRNRACVNPEHLEPVPPSVNILRGDGPPARNARKTHCLRGHVLSPDNLNPHHPNRECLICSRERKRVWEWRHRQKEKGSLPCQTS